MFSKKPAPQQRRPVARPPGVAGATFSVLGPDTTITGDIVASSDLHIDGRVDGDIACQSLVQGETGEISGAVKADTARIAGRIKGSISARELVILKSARIDGDVSYEALTIEQGAQVEGRFSPRGHLAAVDTHPADGEPLLALASSKPPA